MFTGIVESTAEILGNEHGNLTVRRPRSFVDIAIGSSIAVSGACLTVTAYDADSLSFHVIPKTLACTTLGGKVPGEKVNMERALSANGRFDGHMVQGHIEGTGEVQEMTGTSEKSRIQNPESNNLILTVQMPKELITNIVQKGSVTLDGVSLTVADLEGNFVSVALIPHTLKETTLGELKRGSVVNVETDILGRYVAALLKKSGTISA